MSEHETRKCFTDFLKLLFAEDSLKIEKGLQPVEFFHKEPYFVLFHEIAKFHYHNMLTSQIIQ